MKKLPIIALVILFSFPAAAATVEASWNAVTQDVNDQPETISHYILYYGETARPGNVTHPSDGAFSYDQNVNVGNIVQVERSDLISGRTYYFSVAAVDTGGNISNYSSEVDIVAPDDQDGGPTDGGTDAGTDAGSDPGGDSAGADTSQPTDQGGNGNVSGSCSCAGGSSPASLWLIALMLPLVVRRRPE
jgi:MYXO-CTERM domain-containing protein